MTGVALVVGGLGSIGSAIGDRLACDGFAVLPTSRSAREGVVGLDVGEPEAHRRAVIAQLPELDAVFRVRGKVLPDLWRFWSVYLGAFAVNLVMLPLLVEVFRLPVIPAQAGFLAVSAVGTYTLHNRFSFRR